MFTDYNQKFVQMKNLPKMFDLSINYFKHRMHKEFIEGVHFFVPPTQSKTKRAVLWDVEAVTNWLKGYEADDELTELLERKG